MSEKDWETTWNGVIDHMSANFRIGPSLQSQLRSSIIKGKVEDTILISVPGEYEKNTLETKLNEQLTEALSTILKQPLRFAVNIDTGLREHQLEVEREEQLIRDDPDLNPPQKPAKPDTDTLDLSETHLNPKYTFDTYVVGSTNRFAAAAANAVAERPSEVYNPLFIYGGSGLGKTHLLHAIGWFALSWHDNIKVRYVNSEEFTNDFINSISSGKAQEFQNRYRSVDILLIDDIQFLHNKEQTLEEFFHTFNTLYTAGKQIVITSDLPPKELPGFEDRMRSRFEWGLLTDVQPPNLETRIAILQLKAREDGNDVPLSVMEYIASHITRNIRELEGALNQVSAFASLYDMDLTPELAEVVLKDSVNRTDVPQISVGLIKAQTAKFFNISVEQLSSSSREHQISDARQVAMYLCRILTDNSLPSIGKEFGGRDHSTVHYAFRKISEQMQKNEKLYNDITDLTNIITDASRS